MATIELTLSQGWNAVAAGPGSLTVTFEVGAFKDYDFGWATGTTGSVGALTRNGQAFLDRVQSFGLEAGDNFFVYSPKGGIVLSVDRPNPPTEAAP